MSRVVIDIETLAYPLDAFDQVQQEYLLKFASTTGEREEMLHRMNLYPTTARIIAIGMLNPDSDRGIVLFQSDRPDEAVSEDGRIRFASMDEDELLREFWKDMAQYSQFITFNGRGFDCPFLMLRSAIRHIIPSRNLMPYRYDASVHCDLLDQLTFYGAARKFSLDFYCKSFGIESPKSHGITGLSLGTMFEEGRFQEIAEYCAGDLFATADLFRRWEKYLSLKGVA